MWSVLLASALSAYGGPQLHDLDIRVALQPNGDALITETRRMSIDSEGTECYIVIGNLGDSRLSDFSVMDDTGRQFELQEAWDINRSRDWKEGRCGIVTKRDGYELCWGLGKSGSRTYTTRYTVSSLLRGYSDADGFNYMFVAEGLQPSPEHVRLVIVPPDSVHFHADSVGVWAFRYYGDIQLVDDSIVAESSEAFSRNSAMIVMACFAKGMFQPSIVSDTSFEEVYQRAIEDSDYTTDLDRDDLIALVFFVIAVFVVPLLLVVCYFYYVWRQRRKVMKDLLWYRDIPCGGNLQQVNNILNAYRYGAADYNNLLSACILRLINDGVISIESAMNRKGKTVQHFVIHSLPDDKQYPRLLQMVFKIFRDAAGSDTVLEANELRSWMQSKHNQSYADSFIQTLHTKTRIYEYRDQLDEVRQVFGLRKFLKEFTLLDERNVGEIGLWRDYMIFATLFGIADQVIRDMKKINPEYFNMDQVASQMANDTTLPLIRSTMHRSTARAAMSKAEREARASGGGGRSSWGGGGGFSGGGFGGGVR
ncbi:MAG: DUF2207 domain-containing protein [Bacteroidaceae bacterium]|nr:DUF2207 domain-containing protein [Bacteroidaceae bacterium]